MKSTTMHPSIEKFIKEAPKAELHLHIEGSLEPELLFELAERNNVKIPFTSVEEVREAYQFNKLQEFLDIYYQGANVLIEEQDFYDLTYAYLKRAHEDNVVHTEFFFDPQSHTDRGIKFKTVFNGIFRATEQAEKDFGISSFIIMSFLRHLSEEEAFKTLEQSLEFKDKIIGIGLDSSELGNPPEKFERVFKKAKEYGFKLMAHAGEEGPADYVWGSINKLEIDRIDHGNNSLNDEKLIKTIIDQGFALTVCPLSNLSLKVVSDLKNHPLKRMLDFGILATVNSDDPAYFGGYINDNFLEIQKNLNLDNLELRILIENSFKASFLNENTKKNYLKNVEEKYREIFQ